MRSPESESQWLDRTSVLHIEDDPLWASAVAKAIGQWPEFRMVATVPTGELGILRNREFRPKIVILDLRLPDLDGYEVWRALTAGVAAPRVLLLTCRTDEFAISQTSEMDLAGMVLKEVPFEVELRKALHHLTRGQRYFSPAVLRAAQAYRASPTAFRKLLSLRETEVLVLISSGCDDGEIAAYLGISLDTVRTHRQRIMSKLGIHKSAKLVTWAQEKGFGVQLNTTPRPTVPRPMSSRQNT